MEKSGTIGKARRLAVAAQGLVASLVAAALYVLSFPPFNVPEAAYVFVVPILLWGLFGKPVKGEGLTLLGCGWLAWFVLIFWLRNCTQALEMPFAGLFGWALTAALSFILALFWWAWSWIALTAVRLVRDRPVVARMAVLLGMAALWVLIEWVRGVLFTGLPWLTLSVSQWERPLLLQIASVTGGAGISFVLIAFNFGLAFYLQTLWVNRKAGWFKRLSFEFYLALLLLFFAIGYGLQSSGVGNRGRTPGPKLGFVQPDVPVLAKWDYAIVEENLRTLADLSQYASYLGAELILWPESPTPRPLKGDPGMQLWVESLSKGLGIPLLVGNIAHEASPDERGREWYNAAFVVHPETGVDLENYYRKRHLVPFGEFVPLSDWLPFVSKLVPVAAEFGWGASAEPIRLAPDTVSAGDIGNLICYEDIFPQLARANTLAGADWHYVATNNVWFGEEAGAWQHAAHSVLRAVETRRPVVRCGNAGWSGWIDEFGHIRHIMLDDKGSIYFQGVEAVDFSLSTWWANRYSVYVQRGDWFVALCAALALIMVIVIRPEGIGRKKA